MLSDLLTDPHKKCGTGCHGDYADQDAPNIEVIEQTVSAEADRHRGRLDQSQTDGDISCVLCDLLTPLFAILL